MADVKISERLFVELYKFFCMNPGSADYDYIVSEDCRTLRICCCLAKAK